MIKKITHEKFDIDGNLIRKKPKTIKKRIPFSIKQQLMTEAFENKLPNEFKGSIANYNHRSCGGMNQIDDNQYYC